MSFLADSLLLDSDLNHFFHIAGLPAARSHRAAAGGGTGSHAGEEGSVGNVPVDILETTKSYTFFLDVPGVPKSDIQVTLEDDKILAIKNSGKRKREDGEDEGCRYLRLERKAAPKFVRKFRLPEDADSSEITAKCEDGVLTVVVEKLPPPPEPKSKKVVVAVA